MACSVLICSVPDPRKRGSVDVRAEEARSYHGVVAVVTVLTRQPIAVFRFGKTCCSGGVGDYNEWQASYAV